MTGSTPRSGPTWPAAGILAAALPEVAGRGRAGPAGAVLGAGRDRPGRGPGALPGLDRARRRRDRPVRHRRTSSGAGPAPAGRGELILTAALAEEDGDDPPVPVGHRRAGDRGWLLSGTKTAVPAGHPGRPDPGARRDRGRARRVPGRPGRPWRHRASRSRSTAATRRAASSWTRVELPGDRVLGEPAAGPQIIDWLVARAHRRAVRPAARRRRAGAGADGGVRREPGPVRPADRRVPGGGPAPGRRLHRRGGGPAHDVAGGLAAGRPGCPARPRSPPPSSGPPTRATGSRTRRCTCTAAWASTPSYPLHRYFAAAKRTEFELGGATTQLRRIGAALASGLR